MNAAVSLQCRFLENNNNNNNNCKLITETVVSNL